MFDKTFYLTTSLFVCFLSFLFFSEGLQAQSRPDKNWIFGTGKTISFGDGSNQAPALGADMPNGAKAIANDPGTGDLLFYTDGAQVFDAEGTVIATGLGGDPNSNQPVVIVPKPGGDPANPVQEYYIFVNVGGSVEVRTVAVNLATQGYPQASVTTPTNQPVTISPTAETLGEGITVVPNADNTGFWLVTQVPGTAKYYVTAVTANMGTSTSTAYDLSSAGVNPVDIVNLAYSSASNQIAAAASNAGVGVQLLNINPATGALTYINTIGGVAPTESVVDTEWSEDGSKLYLATGNGGRVLQYNVAANTINVVPGITAVNSSGLQLGPDGNVYHLYQATAGGPFLLGSIGSADSTFNNLTYTAGLFNNTDFESGQFAQFSPARSAQYFFTIGTSPAAPIPACQNNPVNLVPDFPPGTPEPDSIVWNVNGQGFTGISPSIIPQDGTPLSVTATAYWPNDSAFTSTNVAVQAFDAQIPLVQDTTICPGEFATLNAAPQSGGQGGGGQTGGGSYQYRWSNGKTTDTIQVNEAGVYWVIVTDQATGCSNYAQSNVKVYLEENQFYNVWYFGNGAGIDFNTLYDPNGQGAITPVGDGAMNAPEGVAAVSDNNGEILFYTDGQTVWFVTIDPVTGDRVHQEAPIADDTGTGIGGNPGTTQVAMVQMPGSEGIFYIFTTTPVDNEDGGYELRYSIVDVRTNAVISSNNLLFVKSTERVTILGGYGANAVLLAHEYGNNNFRAYPISEQGIGQPVISSVGSVHSFADLDEGRGYIKFGGDSTGTVVAVALNDRVELFNFDSQTLELTDPVSIDFPNTPYGVEFASDTLGNTVLMVSTNQGLYSATIDRPINEGDNIPVIAGPTGNFGAIQRGPDGQVYVAEQGSATLRSIIPNLQTGVIEFGGSPVALPDGATSGLGLPDYIFQGGNSFSEPSISVDNACVGNETSFTATPTDPVIDQFQWTILALGANGTPTGPVSPPVPADSLSQDSFTYTFETEGSYRAIVQITNPCGLDTTLVQDFEVTPGLEIDAPDVVNLCNGSVDITAISSNPAGATYEWIQIGAQGGGNLPAQNTITVSEEAFYSVTVTNAEGCISADTIFVADARPPVNLPEDFSICQGEERILDVEIASPAPNPDGYEWKIDNNVVSNDPTLPVNTTESGVFVYTVRVRDNSPEGCFVNDTVVVTVEQTPAFDLVQTPTVDCASGGGGIDLTITSDPGDTYQFSWADNRGNVIATSEDLTNQRAGIYTVTVSNGIGCSVDSAFAIEEGASDFNIDSAIGTDAGCDNNSGQIEVVLSDASAFPISFTITGSAQLSGSNVFDPDGDNTFMVPGGVGLAAGTYNLEVISNGGCTQSRTGIVVSEPTDSVQFTFTQPSPLNVCGVESVPIEVDYDLLTQNRNFTWIGPDGNTIVNNGNEIYQIEVRESGEYSVTVSDLQNPNLCPSTQTYEVNISENPIIEIVQTTNESCETGEEELMVEFSVPPPDGNYIYTWTVGGNFVANGQTITVTESGDYEVTVRNTTTGCFANRNAPITVNEPIIVNIIYGVACEGQDLALFASTSTDSDSLQFAWFGPDGNQLAPANAPRGDSLIVRADMPEGNYTVQVTSGQCVVEETAGIQRSPTPESALGAGPFTICNENTDPELSQITLDGGFAPQIEWTIPSGNFVNTQTIVADQAGIYTVRLTNEFGCSVVDSAEVINDCTPSVFAPNAFVPSGRNNEFYVYSQYVADDDFEVSIYNRWGELIFYSDNKDFRWDGTSRGSLVPPGTYPFVIKFKGSSSMDNNQLYEERGGVTVIR